MKLLYILISGILIAAISPHAVLAAAPPTASPPPSTCTSGPTFNIPTNIKVVTTVIDSVTCVLYGTSTTVPCNNANNSVAEGMFTGITQNPMMIMILKATASLFVIIFAISFMLGIVQLSIIEFLIRATKLSLILLFVLGGGWDFFYNTVGVFFQNGTNWLIARSTQIALGTIPGININAPFAMIDYAIASAFSAKMFVTIMAMLFTGPYGWLFTLLMILGLGSFVAGLFQAMWIYLMSMVVRAFLFGIAPIFFIFLLFQRTRHLFDGWLNQLVNSMLQPVLLFTFFSFFVVLVQAAMENILRVRVCYMPGSNFMQGLPGDMVLPRFTINNQPYGGPHGFSGPPDFPNEKIFPIDIIDVLIFILLTQLAWRFNAIAINIAKEIAGVSTTFNLPGAFSNLVSPRHAATNKALSHSDKYLKDLANRQSGGAATNEARAVLNAQAMNTPKPGQVPVNVRGGPRDSGDMIV